MLVILDIFPQSLVQARLFRANLRSKPLLLLSIVGGTNPLVKFSDFGMQSSSDLRDRLSDSASFTLPVGDRYALGYDIVDR